MQTVARLMMVASRTESRMNRALFLMFAPPGYSCLVQDGESMAAQMSPHPFRLISRMIWVNGSCTWKIRVGRVTRTSDSRSAHLDLSAEAAARLTGLRHTNELRAAQRTGADRTFGDGLH